MTELNNEWICHDHVVAEESKYEVYPEGIYVGEYSGTQRRQSDSGEYYMHKWKLMKNGEEIGETTELSSLKLTENTKLGKIIKSLGVNFQAGSNLEMSSLIGKKAQLVIKIENKNGEKRNTITEHLKL